MSLSSRRDYKNRSAERPGKSGKGSSSLMVGLMVGLVVGLVVAAGLAWFFYSQPAGFKAVEQVPVPEAVKPEAPQAEPSKPAPEPAPAAKPAPTVEPPASPQYSFYEILPGNKTPKPADPPKAKEAWWLQVAALKDAEKADQLKARLVLLGLDTVVQETRAGEATLYRVRVGPFRTEEASKKAQSTLTANNLESRLLKEAVTP